MRHYAIIQTHHNRSESKLITNSKFLFPTTTAALLDSMYAFVATFPDRDDVLRLGGACRTIALRAARIGMSDRSRLAPNTCEPKTHSLLTSMSTHQKACSKTRLL